MALTYREPNTYRTGETYQGEQPSPPGGGELLCLQGALNALANTVGLGEDGAANVWAGTTANPMAMLGALNHKNGSYGLGLNAVCCDLAGVTGLSAVGALNSLLGNF